MIAETFRQKKEEFGSTLLAVTYLFLHGVMALTMGSVYALLGISKKERTLRHAEIFLVTTTVLLIAVIVLAQFWQPLGWVAVFLGNLRIFQIMSINMITIVFNVTPISDDEQALKRARWHFVAIGFSLVDAVLAFGFMYQFFDAKWEILSHHSSSFIPYLYYSLVTMATLGYGDIVPVTNFGRVLAMYEIAVSLFFLVFVVSGAFGRLQRHA